MTYKKTNDGEAYEVRIGKTKLIGFVRLGNHGWQWKLEGGEWYDRPRKTRKDATLDLRYAFNNRAVK